MGGTAASKAECKVELSPSGSGQKSIVTPPMDEFFSADKFWEIYEKQCRAGYTMPTVGKLFGGSVKEHEVTDLPDGSFRLSELIQGGLLGAGDVKLRFHHSFDAEKQEWSTKRYWNEFTDDDLAETSVVKLHSSPLRAETWVEQRHSQQGDKNLVALAEALSKETLSRAGASKTSLAYTADADAITNPGKKSTISEEIAEPMTQKVLLEHWVAHVKDGIEKKDKVDHQVQDLPRGNFVVVDTFGSGHMTYERVLVDEDNFTFVCYVHENDPDLTDVSCNESFHVHFLKDPLRIEFWREAEPGRKVPAELMRIFQNTIDTSIAEATK